VSAEPASVAVPTGDLLALIVAALARRDDGPREDLERAAFWLLQAELLGHPRFGLAMLLRELGDAAEPGTALPVPTSSSVAALDAAGVPGLVALARAVGAASRTAAETGAGIVGLRDLGATGVIGCAARSIAAEGRIGLVLAESAPFVAPLGGTAPVIGTNPIAIAVPREGAPPLVLDFATAPTTIAALRGRAERGEALEPGIAVDAAGAPTVDPSAVAALLPGGLHASLLGLIVQLLAGVAVGGASTAPREGLFAPRGALVVAFEPPNAQTARACAELVERWEQAGGHAPGRLDRLPLTSDGLPATIDLAPTTLEALRRLSA